jgi:hypothetical protein
MELYALNHRLTNVEYINSPTDETFHAELCERVRDFGGTPVPSNHPYAWRRNYEAYEELLRQHGNGTLRKAPQPYVDHNALYIKDWQEYHSNRDRLRYLVERQGLKEADVIGFLKLETGDLSKKFEPGCERKEWDKAACRVWEAHTEVRPLTDEQFTIRFLCFTVKQLQMQLAALAAK